MFSRAQYDHSMQIRFSRIGHMKKAIIKNPQKQLELITPEKDEVQGNQGRQLEWSGGI